MIELDGIEYVVRTPEENAADLVEYINTYCKDNNVQNIYGETIQISANITNPLYMIIFGLSYLITICQKLIYSVGCSNSIAASSDRQLLNIAQEANIKRKPATATSILCTVYATEDGACNITTDLTATVLVGTESVVFSPAYSISIAPDTYANIMFISQSIGAWNISAGSIEGFDTPVANLSRIISQASVPGRTAETIAEFRQRLQKRTVSGTQLDRCMEAMLELPGITLCNIYFNYSAEDTVVVSGVSIPPRQAALFIQGYSDKIAETFYNYLICNVAGKDSPNAITQTYVTKSHQELPVYIIPPTTVPIFMRIYINQSATPAIIDNVRETVMSLAGNMSIGQDLSISDVLTVLASDLPTVDCDSAELSLESGVGYSYKLTPQAGQILTFVKENIEVIGT